MVPLLYKGCQLGIDCGRITVEIKADKPGLFFLIVLKQDFLDKGYRTFFRNDQGGLSPDRFYPSGKILNIGHRSR